MDTLNGISAFVKTAELGSFVAAGRVLEISASAVGKAVARLEQQLGVRLLQRSTRRIQLTDEGRLFLERCRQILDDLDDAQAMVMQARESPRGRLRVSAPIISYHFLLPLIPDFHARHPDVQLDIDFNDRIVDLIDEGIDVAIRSGALPDSRLVSRPLQAFRLLLCAAPAYLARHGTPRTARDLAQHAGVRFRYPNSGKLQAWPLPPADMDTDLRVGTALVCNNMEAVLGATLHGMGIGCMPDFLVAQALSSGDLVCVLGERTGTDGRFNAIWPSSRHLSPKVRVFVDHLSERLAGPSPTA